MTAPLKTEKFFALQNRLTADWRWPECESERQADLGGGQQEEHLARRPVHVGTWTCGIATYART
jgi:hypothetical protein